MFTVVLKIQGLKDQFSMSTSAFLPWCHYIKSPYKYSEHWVYCLNQG